MLTMVPLCMSPPGILSPSTWALALGEDVDCSALRPLPSPLIDSKVPSQIATLRNFTPGSPKEVYSLLSSLINLTPAESGRPARSHAWLGLANSYYAFSCEANLGYAFGCSTMPCASEEFLQLRDEVERLVFGGREFHEKDTLHCSYGQQPRSGSNPDR